MLNPDVERLFESVLLSVEFEESGLEESEVDESEVEESGIEESEVEESSSKGSGYTVTDKLY